MATLGSPDAQKEDARYELAPKATECDGVHV